MLIKDYYKLTKPGIIFGNIITASGGYFLGCQYYTSFNFITFMSMLVGMALVIAAGCVVNNYIDRDIDSLMKRTKNRPSVRGTISLGSGLIYSFILVSIGICILYFETNNLTVIIALLGLFVYVGVYSLWLKRNSTLGTLVGGVSGAVPPIVGYCAITGSFNSGAVILFFILLLWQMPHFFAIAIFRLNDFKASSIPVLPLKKGIHYTKISMLVYIVAFIIASIMPSLFGYTGIAYFIVAAGIGIYWLIVGIKGFSAVSDAQWARKMFFISIVVILLICMMMAVKY
jgi:protoheme IX farnesyltransferase